MVHAHADPSDAKPLVPGWAGRRVETRHHPPIDELYGYGLELMTQADAGTSGEPLSQACQFRDGLMFALLAACPCLRLSNLASIQIGRHLIRQGLSYRLQFTAGDMKSRRPIEAPIPAELVAYLERYLVHYRTVLCQPILRPSGTRDSAQPGQFLWVSKRRTGLSEHAIYRCIVKWSAVRFKDPLTPHLFRDCAATTIATDDPEHVRITASVLGHSSLRTSEKHDNHAQSLEATRRHQENIAALRKSSAHGR